MDWCVKLKNYIIMKKFQYLTFQIAITERDLNTLGREGWELVTHSVDGMSQYYVFKRELNK